MINIKNLINWINTIGTENAKDEIELQNLRLINQYTFIAGFKFFITIFLDIYFKNYSNMMVSILVTSLLFASLFFKLLHNKKALAIVIIFLGLTVFYYTSYAGLDSFVVLFYIPIFLAIAFFFDLTTDRKLIFIIISTFIVEIIINHITDYSLFKTYPNAEQKRLIVIMVLIQVVILIFINTYFIYKKQQLLTDYYYKKKEKEEKLEALEPKINMAFEEVIELAKYNDPTFIIRFKEVYPEFCRKLIVIQPDLTTNELEFCAMLKLNFSTKDIANYKFLATRTIENKKNKIRKRLFISSDVELYTWMQNIDH